MEDPAIALEKRKEWVSLSRMSRDKSILISFLFQAFRSKYVRQGPAQPFII